MNNQFNFIKIINQKIEKEKENVIGISVALIMFGTGLASLNAALAVQGTVSLFILITAITLTMTTAVLALSQQPLKFIAWSFIVSVLINTSLLFYQISLL